MNYLISLLAKYPNLYILREILFCYCHYRQNPIMTLIEIHRLNRLKQRTKEAKALYSVLLTMPEFKSILSYTNKQSEGTVKSIIKDTLMLLKTKDLI